MQKRPKWMRELIIPGEVEPWHQWLPPILAELGDPAWITTGRVWKAYLAMGSEFPMSHRTLIRLCPESFKALKWNCLENRMRVDGKRSRIYYDQRRLNQWELPEMVRLNRQWKKS